MTLLLALALLAPAPQRVKAPLHRAGAHHRVLHHPVRHPPRRPVRRRVVRRRVYYGIRPARALEIQQALVAAGFLARASGYWDEATRAAMQRFQAQHHWQTRFVPDARALIALGLGPASPALTAAAPPPSPSSSGGGSNLRRP